MNYLLLIDDPLLIAKYARERIYIICQFTTNKIAEHILYMYTLKQILHDTYSTILHNTCNLLNQRIYYVNGDYSIVYKYEYVDDTTKISIDFTYSCDGTPIIIFTNNKISLGLTHSVNYGYRGKCINK